MENVPAIKTINCLPLVTLSSEKVKSINLEDIILVEPKSLVKSPEKEVYEANEQEPMLGANCVKMLKMPTTTQITKALALLPVILEGGKKVLVAVLDIRDIWNQRTNSSSDEGVHHLKAVVIPQDCVA